MKTHNWRIITYRSGIPYTSDQSAIASFKHSMLISLYNNSFLQAAVETLSLQQLLTAKAL